jgi:hypothetical protein
MDDFLQTVADQFLRSRETDLRKTAFIFPNRRAGLFFCKYLTDTCHTSLTLPDVLSFHDLAFRLVKKKEADRLGMLFTLFSLYTQRSGSNETFDEFFCWGEMLLGDFDEVDKFLVDARMLFSNVTDLRQIESDFSFLTPAQILAIRSFWSSFQPNGDTSPHQQGFLAAWQILYDLYSAFRQQLDAEGSAYEGMAFRQLATLADSFTPESIGFERLIFVGLHGLTPAETRFVEALKRLGLAEEVNEEFHHDTFGDIQVVGVPSAVGQAKFVYSLLDTWAKEGKLSGEAALRTAIILPDEALLIPLLNAIPQTIDRVNVTMGYPLNATPAATLVSALLALQANARKTDTDTRTFYHKDVDTILAHPYIRRACPDFADTARRNIALGNKVRVSAHELALCPLLTDIFAPLDLTPPWGTYLLHILLALNDTVPPGEDLLALNLYRDTLTRLNDIIRHAGVDLRGDTFRRLLKHTVDGIKIPFSGEPLGGLQIMGLLETRALSFDRVIILSMNEGSFPPRPNDNSFIPHNLRCAFGLPTPQLRDSLWAHHFYRLLHSAHQTSLVYDSRSGHPRTGEPSRFILQLRYQHHLPLLDRRVVYPLAALPQHPHAVDKDDAVLRQLDNFLLHGNAALSASAINTFLDCPLRFYFSVVEGTAPETLVSEAVESNVFGTILHDVLQRIYEPFRYRDTTLDSLRHLATNHPLLDQTITQSFTKIFFHSTDIRPLTGQNFLVATMIRRYVEQTLLHDAHLAPFRYLDSERRLDTHLTLSDNRQVRLKGFIDRLDTAAPNHATRIVDYKSGGSNQLSFTSFHALFDPLLPHRPKEAMQVLLYAWMFLHQPGNPNHPIFPEIYFMRKLFDPPFDSSLKVRLSHHKPIPLDDFQPHQHLFEHQLRACLDDIFDPAIPFTPTSFHEHCRFCPFASLCP